MSIYQNYEILQTLGQGTFGKVKLARRNNQLFAIKFSSQNNAYSPDLLHKIFIKESNILQNLNHPHIIRLYETILNGNYIHPGVYQKKKNGLIFQYAPYNLVQFMQLGALQQNLVRGLFKQLLDGLSYIHSQNIIHRDIKPQNILFDQNFNLKLCDFGLSVKIEGSIKPKTVCGSDLFKSPQMLMKKNYNGLMNDLFAAGVTLFILVTGNGPFISANPQNGNYQYIAMNFFDKFWNIYEKKKKYSQNFKNLLNSMLAFDPTYRLSIAQIYSHPWMNEPTLSEQEISHALLLRIQQIMQKKKQAVLKLSKKTIFKQGKNNQNKRRISGVEPEEQIRKERYIKENSNLNDRFVPKLINFEDLQNLLSDFSAQLSLEDGCLFIKKLLKSQQTKQQIILVLSVRIFSFDEQTDILRFSVRQGNVYNLHHALRQFDQKVFQPHNINLDNQ